MASSIIFAFGPNESFFFWCPTRAINHNTSHAFTLTVPPRLGRPYCICLGPGSNEYCALYESKQGQPWMSANFPYAKTLQIVHDHGRELLDRFIRDGGDLSTIQFALGAAKTFVALAHGYKTLSGPRDLDIPRASIDFQPELYQALLQELDRSDDLPEDDLQKIRAVSIGYRSCFALQRLDGTIRWQFPHGVYPGLDAFLQEQATRVCTVKFIALSPFSPEHWLVVYDQRRVKYALPALFANLIAPAIAEYQAAFTTVTSEDDRSEPTQASKAIFPGDPPPYGVESHDRSKA